MFIFCVPTLDGNDSGNNSSKLSEAWRCGLHRVQTSNRLSSCGLFWGIKSKKRSLKTFKSWRKCYRSGKKLVFWISRISLIACLESCSCYVTEKNLNGTLSVNFIGQLTFSKTRCRHLIEFMD